MYALFFTLSNGEKIMIIKIVAIGTVFAIVSFCCWKFYKLISAEEGEDMKRTSKKGVL